MTLPIICIFILGYMLIAFESYTKINKAAIALLMSVFCWVLYYAGFGGASHENVEMFTAALGETCEIIFFRMGAMVIVEVVDRNGGFNFVREKLVSTTKKALLWKLIVLSFFLSAVLDNMTTSIVMVLVISKMIEDRTDKFLYASMIVLAANSGGAFSPIGDVTTIMLWVKGNITAGGVITKLFLPSVVSVIIPGLLIGLRLKGKISMKTSLVEKETTDIILRKREKSAVFIIGVGGLLFVPIFKILTGLPPFMGILLILGLLWVVTEFIFHQKRFKKIDPNKLPEVSALLHKTDLSTLLFFLGILTCVSALSATGALTKLGNILDQIFNGNAYLITGIIGVLSAIVDNVPLVASCLEMYDVIPATVSNLEQIAMFGVDGRFWELLAYCAGVGGSMLIIGSAAGVVVMGITKIPFGWYFKNITWIAAAGYFAGMAAYWLQSMIF